ncbi:hypothetical protein VE03_09740 [Pseudogymnoascus sp. 23342-1-I1]|nr:hypothetical protein VE03_09740 [Pseudogymnoascus sp. 23342-1-I1]
MVPSAAIGGNQAIEGAAVLVNMLSETSIFQQSPSPSPSSPSPSPPSGDNNHPVFMIPPRHPPSGAGALHGGAAAAGAGAPVLKMLEVTRRGRFYDWAIGDFRKKLAARQDGAGGAGGGDNAALFDIAT